jgi:hypothetical protein
MKFAIPWLSVTQPDGSVISRPILTVNLAQVDGRFVRETGIVDSGADMTMAPRRLCELLGYDWSLGTPTVLRGIAPREECQVKAMIHPVDIFIREAGCRLTIPVCFAETDGGLLLGREALFDTFRIQFDQSQLQTLFELV